MSDFQSDGMTICERQVKHWAKCRTLGEAHVQPTRWADDDDEASLLSVLDGLNTELNKLNLIQRIYVSCICLSYVCVTLFSIQDNRI